MMGACQAGGGPGAVGEAQRGCGALVGTVTRESVMGGAGLRGAGTERRCAGVVDAAALASGEMNEDPLDDLGSLDARDDAQRAATHTTVFDVALAMIDTERLAGARQQRVDIDIAATRACGAMWFEAAFDPDGARMCRRS